MASAKSSLDTSKAAVAVWEAKVAAAKEAVAEAREALTFMEGKDGQKNFRRFAFRLTVSKSDAHAKIKKSLEKSSGFLKSAASSYSIY